MNKKVRNIALGLALGLFPVLVCAALFYGSPYLVGGNPGMLLSFAVMALFALGSIGAFIASIALITRDKLSMGFASLATLLVQWAIALYFLTGKEM